uniref:NADH dehydrogenase subunit 6 n=1 Tax=Fieberiella septentrionalis TaxID=1978376 RepID=A0A890CB64_9HEMI|nr:NADH dehydrogenase subunit 6 [Fieberiella septentrionalis]QRG29281.1 NADH dehydrogenase subunit 6 [Fieberiella septentrionalis]
MKFLILKMMMTMSTMIIKIVNPMTMGVMLLIYTMLSTILLSKIMLTSWMAMIMFLIMIGGLLIIFMYMSSIAANQKFNYQVTMTILCLMMIMPMEEMINEIQINEEQKTNLMVESYITLKLYNKKTWMLSTLLFIYMLICMISITKIVKIHMGPLRSSKTYE